jgi:hypothetical protein
LVAIVVGVESDLLAANAAVLVDPGEGIGHGLAVGKSDVGGRTGIVGELSDRDLGLRGGGNAADQKRQRGRAQERLDRHLCFPPVIR